MPDLRMGDATEKIFVNPDSRQEGRAEDIELMFCNGKTVEQIVDFCGYEQAEVEAVREKLILTV